MSEGVLYIPSLQADQRVVHPGLMVLHHVLVHVRVILTDIPLCAAIRNRSKAERRGVGVGTLKLQKSTTGNKMLTWQ